LYTSAINTINTNTPTIISMGVVLLSAAMG
jgi:hypothetical protein